MSEKVTAQQAAQILGYHLTHIYRLLAKPGRGGLLAQKFGNTWMIDKDSVLALKSQQVDGRLVS
uniref:Putative DNA binding, helix-turn-helix domain containing protein n=1 Tax=viral metagenome TaxID=1070528 RepID=A0A6M3K6W2_9ZZZZ